MSAKKLSNPFSTCPRRQDKVSQGDWIYAADAGWRQSGNVRLLDNSIPPPPLCGFSKAWKTSPWHICIAISHIGRIYAHTYVSVALWHLIHCGACKTVKNMHLFFRDKFYSYDLQIYHFTLTFWYCCKMKITLLMTILKFVMVSESRRLILAEPKFLWYRHLAIPSAMNILAKPLSGIQFHGKTV